MNSSLQRYMAAVIGFGFAAVALTIGIGAAVGCVVCAAAFYAIVALIQRKRLDAFTTRFMDGDARSRSGERSRPRSRRPRYEYGS